MISQTSHQQGIVSNIRHQLRCNRIIVFLKWKAPSDFLTTSGKYSDGRFSNFFIMTFIRTFISQFEPTWLSYVKIEKLENVFDLNSQNSTSSVFKQFLSGTDFELFKNIFKNVCKVYCGITVQG